MGTAIAWIWRKLPRFLADRRGVGAIEFALIAPLLLALYFLSAEFSMGFETDKRVDRVGSMVADLITQKPSIKKTEVEEIMKLANTLLQPYDRSSPKIVVTAIQMSGDPSPKVQVSWSRQMVDGTFSEPFKKDTITTIPEDLRIPNAFVIRVSSSLEYKPLITWSAEQKKTLGLGGAFDNISMSDTYYLRPRMTSTIACNDCSS